MNLIYALYCVSIKTDSILMLHSGLVEMMWYYRVIAVYDRKVLLIDTFFMYT
jgi:hypothetical protein